METTQQRKQLVMPVLLVVFAIALLVALNVFTGGKFLSASNLMNIVVNASVPIFVAWGFTFIFASGVTDLSVGAVIILAANVAGTLGNAYGYAALVAGGVLTAVLLMSINFTVYQITRIPSWIAGLGMMMLYEAVASFYARYRLQSGLRVVTLETQYRALGQAPHVFVVILLGFLLAYFLYNRTTIGLNIRALGNNQGVAKTMGIPVAKTVICSGLVAGIFIGIAAVVKESFAGTVNAVTGLSSLSTTFQPLAAVLMSHALQRYINVSVATLISTIFIMAVFNVLTLLGVSSGTWQETILGLSVIVFGVMAQKRTLGVVK